MVRMSHDEQICHESIYVIQNHRYYVFDFIILLCFNQLIWNYYFLLNNGHAMVEFLHEWRRKARRKPEERSFTFRELRISAFDKNKYVPLQFVRQLNRGPTIVRTWTATDVECKHSERTYMSIIHENSRRNERTYIWLHCIHICRWHKNAQFSRVQFPPLTRTHKFNLTPCVHLKWTSETNGVALLCCSRERRNGWVCVTCIQTRFSPYSGTYNSARLMACILYQKVRFVFKA